MGGDKDTCYQGARGGGQGKGKAQEVEDKDKGKGKVIDVEDDD
jgi:hypothetical protein